MGLLVYEENSAPSTEKMTIPSVEAVESYNTAELVLFLREWNLGLSQEDLDKIKKERIVGKTFLLLTRQDLRNELKFSLGQIVAIEDLIQKLKSQDEDTIGHIESSMEKISITENSAYSKLNDDKLLRRLFKGIAEANDFTFKNIRDEIKSMNHSISETTLSNYYSGKTDPISSNKLTIRKWVEKYIGEWKKDGKSLTILVKMDP